ncbi:response regulator transcription factor [Aliiglaciecola sp. CAU 1673]|uniref:response regulator transcription factor n=1 Tax=Aliiglaciecola sp. CAU 1673 TaxID=3032595 RepID=UPI0023DA9A65|nr:response regulator transcription factor [Aliiglaciecola sp. CAU 1673]MDF2179146.1 response regulator transcription factor [Aliiglaciecola sp. CAU 1673]
MTDMKILLVDDDQDHNETLSDVFSENYHVFSACSGSEAIRKFAQEQPDIVLLDIGLPDTNGHDICRHLKESHPDSSFSVIFVSGHDTSEEVLKAYQAGADDFIAKPFELTVLSAKVRKLISFLEQQRNLSEAANLTREMAFQSMAEAASYGALIEFFRRVQNSTNLSELAKVYFETIEGMNLISSLQIRSDDGAATTLSGAECASSPIEEEVFDLLKGAGRIYQFGHRFLFNYKHVSMLIKNMPKDETECGRLKDLLCIICEGLEMKVQDLRRRKALDETLKVVRQVSQELVAKLNVSEADARQSADHAATLFAEIERGFHFLDLSEEQEKFFVSLMKESRSEMNALTGYVHQMKGQLEKLVTSMEKSLQ